MFKVTADVRSFDARLAQLSINILHLPDAFHNALQGRQGQLASDALRKLTIVPGAPIYPIRWKSQRQRRAFFASNGFGKGIPTKRSYKLLKGWRVLYQRTGDGGFISLVNEVPYMKYVQGDEAQPFHLDTGWIQRGDVVNDFVRETTEQVSIVWLTTAQAAVETKAKS